MANPRNRPPIKHEIERKWPKHYRWIQSLPCIIPGCPGLFRYGAFVMHAHHMRTAANSGMGLKPHDFFLVPMCENHHFQYHNEMLGPFEKLYRIDLFAAARRLAMASPDKKMRAAMLEFEAIKAGGT